MPKIKTHSGAKKRFKMSKNGKPIRAHANKSHILTKKTTRQMLQTLQIRSRLNVLFPTNN